MQGETNRDDYGLLVMIEQMQQQGRSESEIEAAVRDASRRLERQSRPATYRPRRFRALGRRVLGTPAR